MAKKPKKQKPKEKRDEELTTDEALEKLFPKRVVEEVKRKARDDSSSS